MPGQVSQVSTLSSFVKKYLIVNGLPCGRQCKNIASFVTLEEGDKGLAGVYACPEHHVSRAVYFSTSPDRKWFEELLVGQAGSDRVKHRDIRSATRHGWELGQDAEESIKSIAPSGIKELYWTFYPKSDEDKKLGTFLCPADGGGCGKIFTKPVEEERILCEDCSAAVKKIGAVN